MSQPVDVVQHDKRHESRVACGGKLRVKVKVGKRNPAVQPYGNGAQMCHPPHRLTTEGT